MSQQPPARVLDKMETVLSGRYTVVVGITVDAAGRSAEAYRSWSAYAERALTRSVTICGGKAVR